MGKTQSGKGETADGKQAKRRKKDAEDEDSELFVIDKTGSERKDKSEKKKKKKKTEPEKTKGAEDVSDEEDVDEEDAEESQDDGSKSRKKTRKGSDEGAAHDNDAERIPSENKNKGSKRGSEAGRLDESVLPYVREVAALAKSNDFEADEDRQLFVDNVWRELKMGKGEQLVRLITHKEGSTAVQSLLPLSSPKQLYRVCRGLRGTMARVIFNPYGSHVLEALFGFIPRLVNASMDELRGEGDEDEEDDQDEEEGEGEGKEKSGELQPLEDLFQETCEELSGGWMEIMMDARGSHVLRAILRALSGLEPRVKEAGPGGEAAGAADGKGRGRNGVRQSHGAFRSDQWRRHAVPASFRARLKTVASELASGENTGQLAELAVNSAAAPVLQLLLLAVRHDSALVQTVTRALLRWEEEEGGAEGPNAEWVLQLAGDVSGSHMLEAVVEALPSGELQPLVEAVRKQLLQLCRQRTANHVVQRLVEKVDSKPLVRALMQELAPSVSELLQWNRAGVVKALGEAAVRVKEGQGELMRGVCSALNLGTPKQHPRLLPSVLILREVSEEEAAGGGGGGGGRQPVAVVLGSLLVQTLSKFEEEAMGPLLTSVAAVSEDFIKRAATDGAGSRALEALLSSATVPVKAKQKLIDKVTPVASELATDRCGSHVVEGCYRQGNLARKKALAEALAAQWKTLRQSHFGHIVCQRCKVEQFMKEGSKWEEEQKQSEKKRNLFADILEEEEEEEAGGAKAKKGASKRQRQEEEEDGGKKRKDGKKSKEEDGGKGKGKGKDGGKKRRKEDDDEEEGGEGSKAQRRAKQLGGKELDAQVEQLGVKEWGEGEGKKKKKGGKDRKGDGELAEMSAGGDRSGDAEIEELFASKKKKKRLEK